MNLFFLVFVLTLSTVTLATPQLGRRSTSGGTPCRCGIRNGLSDDTSRIVGGREAGTHEFPWQAALMWRGHGWAGCGAAIISSRHILTAAHCTAHKTAEQLSVMLGSDRVFNPDVDSPRYDVEEILVYPGFDGVHGGNDFSLLRLTEPIAFPVDNSIAPVCLPSAGDSFVGADATVSGYGYLGWNGDMATSLQVVNVTVISRAACEAAYPGEVHVTSLCADGAGERDACQGDSGGPLVSHRDGRYRLIGVVSWGVECARPEYPGVYARVTEALSWIQEHTAEEEFCE